MFFILLSSNPISHNTSLPDSNVCEYYSHLYALIPINRDIERFNSLSFTYAQ